MYRMIHVAVWYSLCVAGIGLSEGVSAEPPSAQKHRVRPSSMVARDNAVLHGQWIIVSGQMAPGLPLHPSQFGGERGARIVFFADRYVATIHAVVIPLSIYTLNERSRPKTIDFSKPGSTRGTVLFRGIYSIDGETLRLSFCQGDRERPKDFSGNKEAHFPHISVEISLNFPGGGRR